MISRGKPCCRHRFDGEMIAQMNLFRGQMIDQRNKVPVRRAIISPSNRFRWSIIWLRNKFRWAIISPPKRCRQKGFPRIISILVDPIYWPRRSLGHPQPWESKPETRKHVLQPSILVNFEIQLDSTVCSTVVDVFLHFVHNKVNSNRSQEGWDRDREF